MAGRTNTRNMHKLRKEFYLQGKRAAARRNPEVLFDPDCDCWLCEQQIDYIADPSSTPESHNLDHYYSVDDYPELQEDPTNFRHSHFGCNTSRGKKAPTAGGLGEAVADWW